MMASLALAVLFTAALGSDPVADESSCVLCHEGIEAMHPEAELSCTDCHGGDASASTREAAHVPATRKPATDERVAGLEVDLKRRQFVNPMDLRVVEITCGECHKADVARTLASLHGTTAGHLSDGFYEVGLFEERGSRYSIFPVPPAPREGGEVDRLIPIPSPPRTTSRNRLDLAHHFKDLARKECMQCHLYSQGRAVRGRVGYDGDYRGEGCAACHVPYSTNGLTESADTKAPRGEPGHPTTHTMSATPNTETCTRCHYGDASIGLNFRGLSQLPPGAPGGPDIPGTTNVQLNRSFYLNDLEVTPPDIHHERGMHCIDCHTNSDVMGDGKLHGQMEHAVEISCEACHGTFSEPSNLMTERGAALEHLRRVGDEVFLVSKVDGRSHRVPQVVHVVDETRHEYNPRAAKAMTERHANLECYTCHAGWNANFLGFHFTRNESLSQLDLISGKRTPGRVTTQEKVFATWKSFYAGLNETGRVAPYLTGFSMMGSVYDEDGELILDQVLPETAEGLSGMTMIHHQLHSTRPSARQCVECHRAPGTWGLGTSNFRLGRRLVFAADRRGVEVIALKLENLSESIPLAKFVVPDVVDLVLRSDDLQGTAQTLFVAEGGRGIHAVDVSDPTSPQRIGFIGSAQPRALHLEEPYLYVANGEGGLSILDVSNPTEMKLVGVAPSFDAHDVTVAWPWAYVADGPGGLVIIDVRAPIAPRVVSAIDVNGKSTLPNDTTHVELLFQYSRPRVVNGVSIKRRTPPRHVAAVLDQSLGLVTVDVTEPTSPSLLFPPLNGRSEGQSRTEIGYRGLVFLSQVDLAEAQGGSRTTERDYIFLLRERTRGDGSRRTELLSFDASAPSRVRYIESMEAGYATEELTPLALYNPPFLRRVVLASGNRGAFLTDVTVPAAPAQIGVFPALRDVYSMAVEEFPLDQMVRQDGQRLKDVSHEGSRWLNRSEFETVLTVDAKELDPLAIPLPVFGGSARSHFMRYDADNSGFLYNDEVEASGGVGFDRDGDRRISMLELAEKIGLLTSGRSVTVEPVVVLPEERTSYNGDLSRMLDGVNPWLFDRDRNRRLTRPDLRKAAFAALDLNGDGSLSMGEYSRSPGPAREIRFGDESAERVFGSTDDNGDGELSLREFELTDETWAALDVSGSGELILSEGEIADEDKERGWLGQVTEWPTRRQFLSALPPVIGVEQLLAIFDTNRDQRISRRELERRPELFRELDPNRDGYATTEELERAVQRILLNGVDFTSDGFLDRWDVNGDGEVTAPEMPEWVLQFIERRRSAR